MEAVTGSEMILTSTPKDPAKPKIPLERHHDRHTLQTLQFSATGGRLNGGKDARQHFESDGTHKTKIYHEDSQSVKSTSAPTSNVKIYADPSMPSDTSTVRCSRLVQTDDSLLQSLLQEKLQQSGNDPDDSGRMSAYFDQEAYDLIVKEDVSENYWKDLAEERRRALKETLAENARLSEEIEQLKEENVRLSEVAANAEALKNLLQGVMSDDEGTESQVDEEDSFIEHGETSDEKFVENNSASVSSSHKPVSKHETSDEEKDEKGGSDSEK